mgnify:CR=1 FL=1
MKAFVTSLILLALVVTFVICNTIYMTNITDKMISLAEKLPDSVEEYESNADDYASEFDELYHLWNDNINIIAYTVGYTHIDRTDEAIVELYHFYLGESWQDVVTCRAKCIDAISRLHKLESLHIENIM